MYFIKIAYTFIIHVFNIYLGYSDPIFAQDVSSGMSPYFY